MTTEQQTPPSKTILIAQGKLLDYIDETTQRNETPEEYVRQEIAKSLVREYQYSKDQIAVEFTLRVGSRRPRADLVIFGKGLDRRQENAIAIVECKAASVSAEHKSDGVGQLHSYMAASPNTQYGMWTNGIERFCYVRVVKDNVITFEEVADIPNSGSASPYLERPSFSSLRPATSDALLFAFRRCHNYISGNQGLQKPEAFWELLKLIFCKIWDERNSQKVDFFAAASEAQGMNGQIKVNARLQNLFENVKKSYPQIFKANESVELDPAVLTYAVLQLQKYSLLNSDVDVKGKAYEEIVGSNLRGDRGEFFTPRNVCALAVQMLDPDDRDIVLDPACGTGGFLITVMNHMHDKLVTQETEKWQDSSKAQHVAEERLRGFLSERLFGLDLNPNLVRASKMNMVMNNDGAVGIFQANSLSSFANWSDELRSARLPGSVDVIVTNPPFGSKIPIDQPSVLEQYDLGHQWSYDPAEDQWNRSSTLQKSQPPEILFIERCVQLLRPGSGRAAIVLPDGILGSPGLGYVRQWLLERVEILASIDLHPDTFQPGTSVQTSLLVIRRKSDKQVSEESAGSFRDYEIFMAIVDRIGHDKRGNILYKRDHDGNEVVEALELQPSPGGDDDRISDYAQLVKVIDDVTPEIPRIYRDWLSNRA